MFTWAIIDDAHDRHTALGYSSSLAPGRAIRSASRLRCCFGQLQTNNHTAPLECGDLSPLWPGRQSESGDKLPHSISHSLFVRLLRAFRGGLTRTSNYTLRPWVLNRFGEWRCGLTPAVGILQ